MSRVIWQVDTHHTDDPEITLDEPNQQAHLPPQSNNLGTRLEAQRFCRQTPIKAPDLHEGQCNRACWIDRQLAVAGKLTRTPIDSQYIPVQRGPYVAVPRETPYIWVTWLPRLLIGENSCEWAVWFKAHYQDWTRTPSEFNQTEWMLNHTALLNKRKANWKHGGFDVNIEGQNSFELHGRSATLAGQPDLITQRDGQAVIVDVKNGQDRASHIVQVMIYLYAIPRALERYRNSQTQGAGHLPGPHGPHTGGSCGRPVHTEPGNIDPPTGGRQAARPSAEQTGMSLLRHTGEDCPDRVDEGSEPEGRTTTDF